MEPVELPELPRYGDWMIEIVDTWSTIRYRTSAGGQQEYVIWSFDKLVTIRPCRHSSFLISLHCKMYN
jgi:hypothetical protein